MSSVLELFIDLSKVPRCSKTHTPFIKYITNFALSYGYETFVDKANNILCKKPNSSAKIALQSHYDMVCLSDDATPPTIIEKEGFLYAKNSTLGADNGIGCSMMMKLISQGYDLEYLFTSDEEIGLIGANEIEFILNSSYLINLDSEDEKDICIGCAGGIDIKAIINKKEIRQVEDYTLYEIKVDGLKGGHSGVDIDKNIPNAIKLLVQTIKESNSLLLDIHGGERINSIPKNAKAIVASKSMPKSTSKYISIDKIESKPQHITLLDQRIVDFIYSFANGIREYNKDLNSVISSINLALIKTEFENLTIELSARSMDKAALELIKNETITLLENFGFTTSSSGKYLPWEVEVSPLHDILLDEYKKTFPNSKLYAIHAGLECAVLKDKYPHIQMASIGPNIYYPHSFDEHVEIESIDKVFHLLKTTIKRLVED